MKKGSILCQVYMIEQAFALGAGAPVNRLQGSPMLDAAGSSQLQQSHCRARMGPAA